jgi:hypothetical protein
MGRALRDSDTVLEEEARQSFVGCQRAVKTGEVGKPMANVFDSWARHEIHGLSPLV